MSPFKCTRCGHWKKQHDPKTGKCLVRTIGRTVFHSKPCNCKGFLPSLV